LQNGLKLVTSTKTMLNANMKNKDVSDINMTLAMYAADINKTLAMYAAELGR
jgi:hypothetical protein